MLFAIISSGYQYIYPSPNQSNPSLPSPARRSMDNKSVDTPQHILDPRCRQPNLLAGSRPSTFAHRVDIAVATSLHPILASRVVENLEVLHEASSSRWRAVLGCSVVPIAMHYDFDKRRCVRPEFYLEGLSLDACLILDTLVPFP